MKLSIARVFTVSLVALGIAAPMAGCSAEAGGPSEFEAEGQLASASHAISVPTSPRNGWFTFSDENSGFSCRGSDPKANASLVVGMSCDSTVATQSGDTGGSNCDNLAVHCVEVPGRVVPGTSFWTTWFSEEPTNNRACPLDYWITAFDCSGDQCDNIRFECSKVNGYTHDLSTANNQSLSTINIQNSSGTLTDLAGFITSLRCSGPFCAQLAAGTYRRVAPPLFRSGLFTSADWDLDGVAQGADDWDTGRVKATCPLDSTLNGLSVDTQGDNRAHKAQCTPSLGVMPYFLGRQGNVLKIPQPTADVRKAARRVDGITDWHPGKLKLECSTTEYVSGVSQTVSGQVSAVRCSVASRPTTPTSCFRYSLEGGDSGGVGLAGDWDSGSVKAQCWDNQYVAGISVDPATLHPASILCCSRT